MKLKEMLSIQKTHDGIIFKIKVQPEAHKNEVVGVQGDALKVKINAPPVKGKANRALIDFLAKQLEVKKSDIEIMSGHTSKIKKIKVVGEGGKIKERINEEIVSLRSIRLYKCRKYCIMGHRSLI